MRSPCASYSSIGRWLHATNSTGTENPVPHLEQGLNELVGRAGVRGRGVLREAQRVMHREDDAGPDLNP
jgi:hypothetical protein